MMHFQESCHYNDTRRCEISSSHGGEYKAQNLLGCTAVFLIECRPTFQINMQAVQGIQKKRFWCYLKMQPAIFYINIRQNWLIFLMLLLLNLKEQNGFRVTAT
jgi:hypothetical protein